MNASDVSRFEVTCVEDAGAFIVHVVGEVDLATAGEFEAAVSSGADTPGALIIDLTECGFMDSTGISVLIRARTQPAGQSGRLAIAFNPSGPIASIAAR